MDGFPLSPVNILVSFYYHSYIYLLSIYLSIQGLIPRKASSSSDLLRRSTGEYSESNSGSNPLNTSAPLPNTTNIPPPHPPIPNDSLSNSRVFQLLSDYPVSVAILFYSVMLCWEDITIDVVYNCYHCVLSLIIQDLYEDGRNWIRDGALIFSSQSDPRQRYIFLFSDMLVISKQKVGRREEFHLKLQIPLKESRIIMVANGLSKYLEHSFHFISS